MTWVMIFALVLSPLAIQVVIDIIHAVHRKYRTK